MDHVEALREIPERLGELTYLDFHDVRERHADDARERPDLEILAGTLTFLIKYRSRSNAEAVGSALMQIDSWSKTGRAGLGVPLVVVPYMGEVGRRLCEGAHVNWMDLSGNACIRAPGINVNVTGRPNRYARRGRSQNVFAPKATRLARAFLMYPGRGWLNQELVVETRLSKGYVSKILARLEKAGFIERRDGRTYWPRNPEAMLSAWRESHDFTAQRILRGHVADRTPAAVLRRLAEGLNSIAVRTAITGLAAAWYYNQHAAFRLCSLYVSPIPDADQLARLGFRHVESGSNAWLIQPADEGVFTGVVSGTGLSYVSPLQAYLDLKNHPERAEEASDVLRPSVLLGVR